VARIRRPANTEMTQAAVTDARQADIDPPRPDSLEARASMVLKVLALINVAGVVVALFPTKLPQSLFQAVAFNLAACALAAVEIVTARALDRRRPWAVAVVRPLLVLLIAAGIGSMLLGVAEGRIRVPFESVLAIWALLASADVTLVRRAGGRSLGLVGAVLVLTASMLFGQPLFGWGGLLDVVQSDLRASFDVDCGPSGAGLPEIVTVTYDWSWARTSGLPSGLDIVVIGWTGTDGDGRPTYLFDRDLDSGRGIHSGKREYPSLDMATEVAKGWPASWNWGIDLAEQGLQPGRVELQLRRAREDPPEPGPLVVTASYVHLGVWRTDPISVTCAW
jgi:hypothetical protein